MTQRLLLLSGLLLSGLAALAQPTTKPVLPKAMTASDFELRLPAEALPAYDFGQRAVPSQMSMPGEWEESQAVLLNWPYPSSNTSQYNVLWSKLINAIQQECQVWILVDYATDTATVHARLQGQGVTLTNHRFLIKPTNAYWARDFGPFGFYHGSNDSLGFVDVRYYTGRPLDNAVPAWLAGQLGIPNYQSLIKMEGGNFMVDGFGHGFYSSRLNDNNANPQIQNPAWTSARTDDTVQAIFKLNTLTKLQKLVCDGGTGHIDMYTKLLDEQTLLVTEYPNQVTASDRQTIENNVLLMQTLTSTYGRPFKIIRMPMATRNDGTYLTTCNQITSDARGFVNGLFVNKTFIFPSYSSTSTGNVALDSTATRLYRKLLPGYKIVPIDARLLTQQGGAIHCITMQIPVNNPIRFWHPTVEGNQDQTQTSYRILARISNRSGIAQATCNWRVRGSSAWNTVALTDSAGYYTGAIPNTGFTATDTVEYYLHASSNNGKQMSKPITAPGGYYSFWFSPAVGAPALFEAYPHHHLFPAYPNPARQLVQVPFYLTAPAPVQLQLTDALGRTVQRLELPRQEAGNHEVTLRTGHLSPGIYFYSLSADGVQVKARKLVVE